MRIALTACLALALSFVFDGPGAEAQVGGNVAYGQGSGRARADQNERAKRHVTRDDAPPTDSTLFADASVLMNVRADEFVATFGVAEQVETVEACQAQMDATLAGFTGDIKKLGIPAEAVFVDLTAQTKIYGFKVEGQLAREQLTGFELKKTVAVRYKDRALLDRLLLAASRRKIHDLIKVDYVVSEPGKVQEQLAEAAAEVIKAKAARYEKLLGVKLRAVPQVYADRSSVYSPTEMYDSYTAGESEAITAATERSATTVQSLPKGRTFYYNPLGPDGFDRVINPVILEPVVQYTLYWKVKYEIEARR